MWVPVQSTWGDASSFTLKWPQNKGIVSRFSMLFSAHFHVKKEKTNKSNIISHYIVILSPSFQNHCSISSLVKSFKVGAASPLWLTSPTTLFVNTQTFQFQRAPSTKTTSFILRPESFLFLCEARRHKKIEPHGRRHRLRLARAAKALLVVGRGNLQRDRPDYGSEMRRARLAMGIPPSFCLPRRLNKAWATSLGGMKGSICLLLSSWGEWNGFGWKTSWGGAAGAFKHLRQWRLGE